MQLTSQLDVEKDSLWLLASKPSFSKELPFTVNEIGCFIARPEYVVQHINRQGYLLLYTVEGEGVLESADKTWHMKPGSLVYFDRVSNHVCRNTGSGNWKFYWVHLEGLSCSFYYETIFKNGFTVVDVGPGMEDKFKNILENFDNPAPNAYLTTSNLLSDMLTTLADCQRATGDNALPHFDAIQRTIQYIKEQYNQPIDVGELAEMAQLSKYYYIKMFRDVMHTTPYEYLLQYRINESCKLLRSTKYKASEIAMMVGFADECNFSRTFKRLRGATPLQYRKNA